MKIVIVTNQAYAVWQLRREFLAILVQNGHDVTLVSPEGDSLDQIRGLGVSVIVIPLKRHLSPLYDLYSIWSLYRTFSNHKFDIAYTISVKPNIYGTIAARLAGVPKHFGLVCGLGTAFLDGKGLKQKCLQFIVRNLYRIAGQCTDKLIFQNDDDRRFMIECNIVPDAKTHVIKSSGVNFGVYSPELVDPAEVRKVRRDLFGVDGETIVVGVLSRALESKGVREFIHCSREAESWNRKIRFIHVGEHDTKEPHALKIEELSETKLYKWVGFRSDVSVVIQAMDILTLPSYREGVPRSLLEGMALCKPIVTTDTAGCRETVDHGINGLIVPPRDADALAGAIKKIAFDDELRLRMGMASRRKAEREFDVHDVNRRIIEEVFGLPCATEAGIGILNKTALRKTA